MKTKIRMTFAAVAAVAFAAHAETVLWHFGGRDGQEAPATIADVSGMTLDAGDFVVGEDFVGNIVGVRFTPAALQPNRFMAAGTIPGLCLIFR